MSREPFARRRIEPLKASHPKEEGAAVAYFLDETVSGPLSLRIGAAPGTEPLPNYRAIDRFLEKLEHHGVAYLSQDQAYGEAAVVRRPGGLDRPPEAERRRVD
jgi:hypothetical protein